jgi:chorismate mutase
MITKENFKGNTDPTDLSTLTFENRDEFNRKQVAVKAISLLRSEIDVSPMVVDGSWGIGKTEFCYKLIKEMEKADTHHLIYVDAFKADHADEPLLTVLSEILKIVPDKESRDGFIKKSIPAIRFGIKTALKAGVSHVLRQDATDVVDDFEKEIKDTTNKVIDSTMESILNDHIEADKNLSALHSVLNDIAKEKPIVIFIDELDRCRPKFAIDMLEVMKHTFNVKGVQFVMITNTVQLKASINHCYGEKVDAQRYLDKFLKFRFSLPHQVDRYNHYWSNASHTYLTNLINESTSLPKSMAKPDAFSEFVSDILKYNKSSLREVETFHRYLEIYQHISDQGFANREYLGYSAIKFLSVFIFSFKPELVVDVEFDDLSMSSISELLGVNEIPRINARKPTVSEVILLMLSRDVMVESLSFNAHSDDFDKWDEYISQGFSSGMDENECSNIMKGVIKDLALAGH